MKEFEEKKKNGIQLSKEERMQDAERQLKRRSTRVYPSTLGITGEVFKTGKIKKPEVDKNTHEYMKDLI